MNRTDVVKSAIAHKNSGHVPYAIMLTGEARDAYGEQLLRDYRDERVAEDLACGRISYAQAVSLSIGNHILYLSAPWWGWYNLPERFLNGEDTPDTLPDTVGDGDYGAFFKQCEYLRTRYDAYQLVTIWGSHWEKAYFSRGIENFLYDLAADPEWSQSLLDLIIEKNLVMLQNILAAGDFDGILLGSDWGMQKGLIMSPATWRAMIRPGELREYELIRRYGKHIWIHSCGDIQSIMPDLCQMGVDVINPVQPECMDIRHLKEAYGDRIGFYGGISTQQILPYGSPGDVIRCTEETIALMAKGGGYITAPSQEIQTDVPYENLRALIDTARAHS